MRGSSHAVPPSSGTRRATAISASDLADRVARAEEWRSYISVVVETFQPWLIGPSEVRLRHLDVGEEDLVEVVVPGRVSTSGRTLTPGVVMSDQQTADALVLGRVGIGADEQDDPVGVRARPRSTPSGR